MKSILCYGDSNTWGHCPGTGARHSEDDRWPCVMARELGAEYRVLESGLNGRSTVYDDPTTELRNGKEGLGYALVTNKPLNLVILMLGTNDLKYTDAYGAARGAESLIKKIKGANALYSGSSPVFAEIPEILLVSPIRVAPEIDLKPVRSTLYGKSGESELFSQTYAQVAQTQNVHFLDAAQYGWPSKIDCVHMDAEAHHSLGRAMAEKVREIYAGI